MSAELHQQKQGESCCAQALGHFVQGDAAITVHGVACEVLSESRQGLAVAKTPGHGVAVLFVGLRPIRRQPAKCIARANFLASSTPEVRGVRTLNEAAPKVSFVYALAPGGDLTMHHLGEVALDPHVVPFLGILIPELRCGHQHGARVDVRSADPSVVNDHDSQCKEWPRHAHLEGSEQGGRATDCVT